MLSRTCHTSHVGNWNASLQAICGIFNAAPTTADSAFIGEIAYRELAGVGFTLIRTNASMLSGEPATYSGRTEAITFLVMQMQGESVVTQYGQSLPLSPGDMILLDSSAHCEIRPNGLMTHASVKVSEFLLRQRLHHAGPLFRKISSVNLSGRLLQNLIRDTCHDHLHAFNAPEPRGAQDAPLNEMILSLLSVAWRNAPAGNSARRNHHESIPLLRDIPDREVENKWIRAQMLVAQYLRDPALSPDFLSKKLGISRRQVHRLFKGSGETPARYIHSARLSCIANDLIDPRLSDRTITQLAYYWGFADSANFSHAFRKAHGLSPRAYRRRHLYVSNTLLALS